MIEPADADSLRSVLAVLEIPVVDIWIAYVGLGGDLSASCIESFLHGGTSLGPGDYDRLAQVANEEVMERGGDHPVPYAEDLAGSQSG